MLELLIANKNYSSWSLRPWVLMRELGIAFKETLVPFAQAGEPSPFFAFSPTGKVPCLKDGEVTVWDSLAITEYLAERKPGVWPSDGTARAWARCAAAEMHSGFQTLRSTCGMSCGVRVRIEPLPAALLADVRRIEALWQDGLSRFGGPWLAGSSFSAVDAFFAPVAYRVQTYDLPVSAISRAYVDRLLALPSMQEWYRDALKEPWRDEVHDDEIRRAGKIVEDLRR